MTVSTGCEPAPCRSVSVARHPLGRALLRTPVAEQAIACTTTGKGFVMAVIVLAPMPRDVAGDSRDGFATSVMHADGSCIVVALSGEANLFSPLRPRGGVGATDRRGRRRRCRDRPRRGEFHRCDDRRLARGSRNLPARDGRTMTVRSPSEPAARVLDVFRLGDVVESQRIESTTNAGAPGAGQRSQPCI